VFDVEIFTTAGLTFFNIGASEGRAVPLAPTLGSAATAVCVKRPQKIINKLAKNFTFIISSLIKVNEEKQGREAALMLN
jgi:hypothetical protein